MRPQSIGVRNTCKIKCAQGTMNFGKPHFWEGSGIELPRNASKRWSERVPVESLQLAFQADNAHQSQGMRPCLYRTIEYYAKGRGERETDKKNGRAAKWYFYKILVPRLRNGKPLLSQSVITRSRFLHSDLDICIIHFLFLSFLPCFYMVVFSIRLTNHIPFFLYRP